MFTGIDIFINMINEEIDKIKYLFGYKPGVVISEQTTGSTPSTGVTTTPPSTGSSETTKIKQKDLDKLRDCADYNSTGAKSNNKLTKGEETKEFVIFNGSDGKPACKKPKEKQ
jgi:hypothetical protein